MTATLCLLKVETISSWGNELRGKLSRSLSVFFEDFLPDDVSQSCQEAWRWSSCHDVLDKFINIIRQSDREGSWSSSSHCTVNHALCRRVVELDRYRTELIFFWIWVFTLFDSGNSVINGEFGRFPDISCTYPIKSPISWGTLSSAICILSWISSASCSDDTSLQTAFTIKPLKTCVI